MYEILNDILDRVRQILYKDYSHETRDFKRGYRYCTTMYAIGLERASEELKRANIRYNQSQQIKELERELRDVMYKLKHLQENPPKTKFEDDERFIHIIASIAKDYSKRLMSSRKEERERITEIFKRYI